MEEKKTLTSRLTTKYLLIIRNEENFAEKTTYSFTYAKIILFLFFIFLTLAGSSFYLVTTVLEQWFDPRFVQLKATRETMELSLKIDSLTTEVNKKDAFIGNLRLILSGQTEQYADIETSGNISSAELKEIEQSQSLNPIDSQFRQEFEKSGVNIQLVESSLAEELQDFYLFKPVDGVVSGEYNPQEEHYAIDIVSKEDEPVKAVADGTVIIASWTQDGGYVIGIQHRGNLISMYKHNSELTKSVGSFVTAGEVISIIGNTGELTTGPHLHFELWYDGNPIDPQEFIRY